ncbi:MAG: ParB/RepB/Spo0J family partition protein [Deltaproteobacteria bacterium]|nr:ParB/RepB/Spo0J family partition protein [Deltaproteobacteria bacterium]
MKNLEILQIPIEKLEPNPWNPNRLSEELQHKLREYLRREGLVEPLVVRPKGDNYEILGGYHRWKICREELGYTTVPCVVVELDDRRAKVLSLNLNELKGQPAPDLLAALIHDLNRELSLEDLSTQLPYSQTDLREVLELLKVPDGLQAYLDEEIERAERERPKILSFVVQETGPIEEAIAKGQASGGPGTGRGAALLVICRAYLKAGVKHDPRAP